MKIVRLSAENVKRLQAVEVTPEGTLVTVGGLNGAGKSSVLDSIAYALGGQGLVPSEPIRKGEESAKIEVDLGDYVVVRRFVKKGNATTSTLVVKNKEGATYPSPQAILDKLLGKLTFDPLQFARAEEGQRRGILASLIDVDTALFDAKRKAAFDRRTALNRDKKSAEAQFAATTHFKDVPEEEVSLQDITSELEAAEKKAVEFSEARALEGALDKQCDAVVHQVKHAEDDIATFEKQIKDLQAKLKSREKDLKAKKDELLAAVEKLGVQIKATSAIQVPDTAAIRAKFEQADQVNRKVRANQKREEHRLKVEDLEQKVEAETLAIETAEAEKSKALAEAAYPIPGLSLQDFGDGRGEVTYNGHPFEQASTSEQLRVSVAIGLAMNPTLKVLLIRNGNSLDENSLKQIAEQATAADAQIWMEWVTPSKDGMSVMIEDGLVVE